MASARLVRRELPSGVRYYAKYVDNEGKERMRLAGLKKKDADDFLTELKKELKDEREGRAAPKSDMVTTLKAWVDDWVETTPDLRPHSRMEYRRIFESDTGLVASYGHLALGALNRQHVKKWMADRANAGAARLTIRNNLAPVRAALSDAIEEGKIRENPCALNRRRGKKSAVPGRAPKKVTAPEPALVAKVLAAAEGEFATVLLVAAACGLRRGEIYGLRWSDISESGKTIKVSRSNVRGELVEPKTEASTDREVPLFPSVRKALLEHKLRSKFSQPGDLIFPDPVGRPARPSTVADRDLQTTFKKAGLPARCFTFHSLRHYAVTQARRVGKLDVLVCQKIAGHASPDITLKVYSHLFASDIADAADAFDPFAVGGAAR